MWTVFPIRYCILCYYQLFINSKQGIINYSFFSFFSGTAWLDSWVVEKWVKFKNSCPNRAREGTASAAQPRLQPFTQTRGLICVKKKEEQVDVARVHIICIYYLIKYSIPLPFARHPLNLHAKHLFMKLYYFVPHVFIARKCNITRNTRKFAKRTQTLFTRTHVTPIHPAGPCKRSHDDWQ